MFKKNKMKKAKKDLKDYILDQQKNKSNEEIKESLLKIGWKEETIGKIFKEIKDGVELTIPITKKKEETPEEKKIIQEEKEEPKKGLVGQLKEIRETLDIISDKKKQVKKLKKKKFKIPFKVKSQLKKLAVKDKVQVLLLQRTRNIKPVIGEIRDGMLMIKDMIYNGSVDSTWLWNGKYPTHLVPEWDLQPLTPDGIEEMKRTSTMSAQELMNYCIKFGRSAVPGKIIIRAIEAKQNMMLSGSKASMKTIIITIVIVIIVMAVLFGGGVV